MKAKEIRELEAQEVTAKLEELERERFNLKIQSGTQTLEKPLRLRAIRRDIARLKTVQNEKRAK